MAAKHLVLVSGKLQSGKNTFSDFLTEEAKSRGISVQQGLFADRLKSGALKDFQIVIEFLHNEYQRLRAHGIPHEEVSWMDVIEEHFYEEKTPFTRRILQLYGTDIFRNRVDEDHWVKELLKDVDASSSDIFVVTDTRFPNEIGVPFDWCRDRNVSLHTVRVLRSGTPVNSNNEHPSETALDGFSVWDQVVENDGPLLELKDKAIGFLDFILSPKRNLL
jgi:hypothetical protein